MRRDKDYLRDLLLEMEGSEEVALEILTTSHMNTEEKRRNYHFLLLCDAGLTTVVDERRFFINEKIPEDASGRAISRAVTYRLTHEGHEFLDAVRCNTVWQRTKRIIGDTVGSVTLSATKAIAVGLIKKEIEEHAGIRL